MRTSPADHLVLPIQTHARMHQELSKWSRTCLSGQIPGRSIAWELQTPNSTEDVLLRGMTTLQALCSSLRLSPVLLLLLLLLRLLLLQVWVRPPLGHCQGSAGHGPRALPAT